ncbi:uncharacterized protein LOC111083924 [Limulus polyphemus]|uniref:Uncharacterized protein LOC111083924 n=1 Tax=Limulus polyphemus TaxID=6850 RepID=A0ABM1RYB8_LIMPO|nr:uncharacterized protein LOC111083924 [Limulus polyphemus]
MDCKGSVHTLNYTMKPITLPDTLRINEAGVGGASTPTLSPNLPSIVKVEPRLPSPRVGSPMEAGVGVGVFNSSKRLRLDNGSQMCFGSLSLPPPYSMLISNGLSPDSVSSYDGNSLSGEYKYTFFPLTQLAAVLETVYLVSTSILSFP